MTSVWAKGAGPAGQPRKQITFAEKIVDQKQKRNIQSKLQLNQAQHYTPAAQNFLLVLILLQLTPVLLSCSNNY